MAVAIGRISVRIFGEASPAGQRVAAELGRALQLTDILCDLAGVMQQIEKAACTRVTPLVHCRHSPFRLQ
jgi:hypothetical protein